MKAPIGVLTPVTINDCVLAIVMVLDLAESTHSCNPSWARPAARQIPPGRAHKTDDRVGSDLQARRALGRDLVKLLHCILDVSRLRLGHTLEALKAVLPELLRETAELLRILGLAHLEGFFDGPDPRLVLSVKRLTVLVQHIGDR